MTAPMKQTEKKLRSLENEKRLSEKTCKELMRRYLEKRSVMGRSLVVLVKHIATCFAAIAICISEANPECYWKEVAALNYLGENRRQNWTKYSRQCSSSGSNGPVLALKSWDLEALNNISKYFDKRTAWGTLWKSEMVCKLWKGGYKKSFLREVSNNVVSSVRFRQSL